MLQYIVTRRFYTKNTMEEQLIQYETALLAKEKGFNEYCKKEYVETLEHTLACRGGDFTFQHQPPRIIDIGIKESYDKFHAKAPTQSLLQKWLRGKQIDITVITDWKKGKRVYYVGFSFVNHKNEIDIWFSKDEDKNKIEYPKYEDALEVGLRESLETVL